MNLYEHLRALKNEMDKLEKMSYKELADLPYIVKNVGKPYIDNIMTKMEKQNEIIKKKFADLEDFVRENKL